MTTELERPSRYVFTYHSNRPRQPNGERPAIIVSRWVVTEGSQGVPPVEGALIVCDDGETRAFVSGPEGRWKRA